MKELLLNGDWKLQTEKELNGIEPDKTEYVPSGWLTAIVPGTVQQAYLSAGKYPHPFFEDNAKQWQSLENEIFWYRRDFFVPQDFKGKKITLDFEGLDTFATIYLNGKEVGKTANAFVPFSFDVTRHIRHAAINVIAVKFDPPWQVVGKKVEALRKKGYPNESFDLTQIQRIYIRRPQVSFGWDFAVRLLNVGIWRNVRLRAHDAVSMDNVFIKTVSLGKTAEIEMEVRLTKNTAIAETVNLNLKVGAKGKGIAKKEVVKFSKSEKSKTVIIPLSIKNPQLWFPHNIGKPNLYQAHFEIMQGAKLLDSRNEKFGIRIIKLVQKEDGENRFTFNINGVNVFCKGANWVPADSITTDASADKYKFLLQKFVDGNMNMLRIWGGGIYENDLFYNLCDELGIMVWQDFLYACAMYPDEDTEFMKNVADESTKAVIRLRNHASIVLWCGNNENQVGWANWGWNKMAPRHYGEKIYAELLPKICSELDSSRPYHPGSPYGGEDPNSWDEGDVHDWRVWHGGVPYQGFEENTGRFISEWGLQGAAHIDTVKTYLSQKNQWPLNELWKYHHLDSNKMEKYLVEFGEPKSVEEYVTLTQLAQAQTYKFTIESFRRRKFHCSGSLFWQYNDPWPTMCWSVVDYYHKPKASYFWSQRACQNILPVFKENHDGSLEVWVINDTLRPVQGKLEILYQDFDGKIFERQKLSISLSANASEKVSTIQNPKSIIRNPENGVIRCRLTVKNEIIENAHYLALFRDLKLSPAKLKVTQAQVGEKTVLKIRSDKLIRFVELSSGDGNLWFSDNYFDVYPGETKEVHVTKNQDARITIRGINVAEITI